MAGGTLNSSAANLRTAVNGVASGTERTLKGSFGSEVRVILNVTLELAGAAAIALIIQDNNSGILQKIFLNPL